MKPYKPTDSITIRNVAEALAAKAVETFAAVHLSRDSWVAEALAAKAVETEELRSEEGISKQVAEALAAKAVETLPIDALLFITVVAEALAAKAVETMDPTLFRSICASSQRH